MANEVKLTIGLKYSPSVSGIEAIDTGIREMFADSDNDYTRGTQTATSTEAKLDSQLTDHGYVFVFNTDEETDVRIGFADVSVGDDARPINLKPRTACLFHAAGDIYVATASGTARLEYVLIERDT